jgi:hypothetical protein
MILAITHSIRGAVISRGGGDRDAKSRCVLKSLVQGGSCLGGILTLCIAPTNRDHGGFVLGVVDRLRDRVHKTSICVGCKIDDDFCARSSGTGYFDIQRVFAGRLTCIAIQVTARAISRTVH